MCLGTYSTLLYYIYTYVLEAAKCNIVRIFRRGTVIGVARLKYFSFSSRIVQRSFHEAQRNLRSNSLEFLPFERFTLNYTHLKFTLIRLHHKMMKYDE